MIVLETALSHPIARQKGIVLGPEICGIHGSVVGEMGIRGSLTPNAHLQTRSPMHPRPRLPKSSIPSVQPIPSLPHHPVTESMATSQQRHAYPKSKAQSRWQLPHATRGVASQTSRAKHSGLGVMPRLHMQVANQGRVCSQSFGALAGYQVAPRAIPFLGWAICLGIFEARLSLRVVYALSRILIL